MSVRTSRAEQETTKGSFIDRQTDYTIANVLSIKLIHGKRFNNRFRIKEKININLSIFKLSTENIFYLK